MSVKTVIQALIDVYINKDGGKNSILVEEVHELLTAIIDGMRATDEFLAHNSTADINSGDYRHLTELEKANFTATKITTVGTGGEYETIGAAVMDGNYYIKLISNITENSNINIAVSKILHVDFDVHTANFQTFNFVFSADSSYLYITGKKSAKIQFAYSSPGGLFSPLDSQIVNNLFVENVTIDNNSTVNGAMIADRGHFDNVRFELPNFGYTGISGTTCFATILNSEFVGGGTSCIEALKCYVNDRMRAENLVFSGTFGNYPIFCQSGIIENLAWESQSVVTLLVGNIDGLSGSYANNITLDVRYAVATKCRCKTITGYSFIAHGNRFSSNVVLGVNAVSEELDFHNNRVLGNLTIPEGLSKAKISDNYVTGNFVLRNSDYNKITNNIILGTSTIESGAENNIITGNTFTSGLTDNSGLYNVIKDNIGQTAPIDLITTVGTGGNYPTIGAAIAAGKGSLKLISNVTETADIAVAGYLNIDFNSFTLNMGAYGFSFTNAQDYKRTFANGKIKFKYTTSKNLIYEASGELQLDCSCDIINESTVGYANIGQFGWYHDAKITLPNFISCGFGMSITLFAGKLDNIEIVGGGTSCSYVIYNAGGGVQKISNIRLSGSFASLIAAISHGTNIFYAGTTEGYIYVATVSNIHDLTPGRLLLRMTGNGVLTNFTAKEVRVQTPWDSLKVISAGVITKPFTINEINAKYSDVRFIDEVIISASKVRLIGCIVGNTPGGTKKITINNTADGTMIIGNQTEAAIVDNGTNTVGVTLNTLL